MLKDRIISNAKDVILGIYIDLHRSSSLHPPQNKVKTGKIQTHIIPLDHSSNEAPKLYESAYAGITRESSNSIINVNTPIVKKIKTINLKTLKA